MKRFLLCTLAVLVLTGAVCLLTFFSKDAPYAYALSNTSSRLYVAKNEAAGVPSDIILISDGTDYTLYLPGSAVPEALFFSWGTDTTVLDANGNPLTSGAAPIAAPGASVTYNVNGGNRTIYTQKGSPNVRAMFLETDETLAGFASFQDMYDDDSKETKAAGTMALGSDSGYYFSIKGRGNSTWKNSKGKKPYNITLYKDATYDKKQAAELIDGVEAKTWSLLANEGDQSLLRNKLGYDMAYAMGIGLRSDFVDLYADGEYLGCYLMTPKSDYQAPDDGFILEIDNYIDNEDPQFTLEGLKEYHPTEYGFQNRFTVKENNTDLSTDDLQSYMQSAWDALLEEDSDEYLKYIDLDSWAKYYLLHEYYKSFDVVCGSILMHRDGTVESDKLIAGPVWDLDNALGRINDNPDLGMTKLEQHSPKGWYIQNVTDPVGWWGEPPVTHFWLQQLGKHESFIARVRELYLENEGVFLGSAPSLDQISNRIETSAQMNFLLHGISRASALSGCNCGCATADSWMDFVANLRCYAVGRTSFLAEDFRKDLTITLAYENPDSEYAISSITRAYADTYGTLPTPTRSGYAFEGWYTGAEGTGQQVTAGSVVMNPKDHSLYAKWTKNLTPPTTTVPVTTVPATTTTAPTVPGTSSTAPTVPDPSTTAPTVPGTSSTAPTVPGTSSTAPTVPDVTTAAPTVPPVTPTAPTVPGTTAPVPTVPAVTTTSPTVPGTTTIAATAAPTIPGSSPVTTAPVSPSTSISNVGGAEQPQNTGYTIALTLLGVLLVGVAGVAAFFFYKNKKKD